MLHFSELTYTKSIAVQENRSQTFICLDLKLNFCNCKFKYNWTMSFEILFGLFFMDFSICILRQDNFLKIYAPYNDYKCNLIESNRNKNVENRPQSKICCPFFCDIRFKFCIIILETKVKLKEKREVCVYTSYARTHTMHKYYH